MSNLGLWDRRLLNRVAISAAVVWSVSSVVLASPCNCVPTTHQVRVPGIVIDAPVINSSGSGSGGYGSSGASSSASAGASVSLGISTQVSVTGSLGQTSNAAANLIAYGGGGGGWFSESGPISTISMLQTEMTPLSQRVCAQFSAALQDMRIEASCIDDKETPHPASQTNPDRALSETFEGEIYRCIAGARLQYTVSDVRGGPGRTLTCDKGQALNRNAVGQLLCKAQIPARDCNERSLLRRFGPGLKQVKLAMSPMCIAWKEGDPAAPEANAISFDGGVGGVVR